MPKASFEGHSSAGLSDRLCSGHVIFYLQVCIIFMYYWVKVVTYAAVIFLCRKRCAVGKSMIYMSFLLDESIVCGIDFSNTLQGHTCF